MTNRLKGTIIGILLSLLAIGAWVILAFLGFIAGLAGALMGILFVIGYTKTNKEDKSKYPIIVACVLIVVEIVIAELITIFIYASAVGLPLSDALAVSEVKTALLIDIGLGLVLSFLVFIGYVISKRKKDSLESRRYSAPINNPNQPQNGFNPQNAPQQPYYNQPEVEQNPNPDSHGTTDSNN